MDEIFIKKEDGVGILTINRAGKMNAITGEMWTEFRKLLEEARDDDDVKALVLTGTGRAFCAGTDVVTQLAAGMSSERPERMRKEILERVDYVVSTLCSFQVRRPPVFRGR